MDPFDIIFRDINSQPVAAQKDYLFSWLERAIYLWCRLSGFDFHISEIKRLKLDGYRIKKKTLLCGGGKLGILIFLQHVRQQLEKDRNDDQRSISINCSTIDFNYSDVDLNRMIHLDAVVARFGIDGAPFRIVEIMDYMLSRIGVDHAVGQCTSALIWPHGSKFDNDPKRGRQPVHAGIHRHHPYSSMPFHAHQYQHPHQVNYSSSFIYC